jgi:DNA polymerase-3 subunit gamma/tau
VVEVGATQDTPARRDAAERVRRQQEAEDLILNDPAVVRLMQQFPGARIVPGSVKPL